MCQVESVVCQVESVVCQSRLGQGSLAVVQLVFTVRMTNCRQSESQTSSQLMSNADLGSESHLH